MISLYSSIISCDQGIKLFPLNFMGKSFLSLPFIKNNRSVCSYKVPPYLYPKAKMSYLNQFIPSSLSSSTDWKSFKLNLFGSLFYF